MANIKSFSSVSIRDLTDLGNLLLYTTSNQPLSVIYDPNANTYLPNWANSNLVITPVIQYNGSALPLNASGLTITYTKKAGSGAATELGTGESVSGGILIVSGNILASIPSGLLTYICHVSYTDPQVGVPIDTETTMTYTLISQASEVKSAFITGENAFLYDTERNLVGSSTITLTANINNTSIQQWQYKKSDGTFEAFPTTNNPSITGNTLVVSANEAGIWLNNRQAVIKLVTADNNVYDMHEIMKIYDGTAGNATLVCQLSNSSHYVPCDSSGNVTSWNGSSTQIYIYEGGTDVTNDWTINTVLGSGLTGTYDSTTHVFTPSGLTDDTSYCDFVCTQTDYSTLTVRYTITRSKMGADGKDAVIYSVEPNVLTLNKNESDVFTPSSVTFYGWRKVGDALNNTAYSGRFKIEESLNGVDFSTVYSSSTNEASRTWSPTSANVKIIKCTLYEAGGATNALDEQSVIVTHDGVSGQDGAAGANGISMGLGNYQDVLPCKSDTKTAQAKDITIPFYAYSGIQRIPVTATVGTRPTGITIKSNSPGDATKDGVLVLTVANNSDLGSTTRLTGDITITLTCTYNTQTQSVDQKYTWTKSIQSESSAILQIYSEDGGVIRNSSGSTTLKIRMVAGASEVTPTSIQWAKYENGTYTDISGATGTSLTVTDSLVDDLAFFRATVGYNGNNYVAFYTVDDIQDPVTATVFATVHDFKNHQGFGAVYCRVYRAGQEIDPIRSTTFSNVAPSAPTAGDFYYHLDPTLKTCVLKKYNGSSWVNATETDELSYAYYRRDYQGNELDTDSPYKTDRCIYVDPSIINGTMSFDCEVTG